MYCINCGKQVDGNIPLCSDCALAVIQEHFRTDAIANKIETEAQEFSVEVSLDEFSPSSDGSEPKEVVQDDDVNMVIIIGVVLFLIFFGSIIIAYS